MEAIAPGQLILITSTGLVVARDGCQSLARVLTMTEYNLRADEHDAHS